MLQVAIKTEVEAFLEDYSGKRDRREGMAFGGAKRVGWIVAPGPPLPIMLVSVEVAFQRPRFR